MIRFVSLISKGVRLTALVMAPLFVFCDDPGLMGALIGAPVGAVTGGILGPLFF